MSFHVIVLLIDSLTCRNLNMLELMLLSSGGGSRPIGVQEFIVSSQVGQPDNTVGYGYCSSFDNKAFFILHGKEGELAAPRKLFRYNKETKVWTDLGVIPAWMGNNLYWSIVAVDDDTLVATLRDICAHYKISTGTWVQKAAIPLNCQMYGTKSHYADGKVYQFAPPAGGGSGNIVVSYDAVTDKFTLETTMGSQSGVYAATALANGRLFIFPGPSASASGLVFYYDLKTKTIHQGPDFTGWRHTLLSAISKGNYIYIFGCGATWDKVVQFNGVTNTLSEVKLTNRPGFQWMPFEWDNSIWLWGGRSTPNVNPIFYRNFLTYSV